MPTIQWISEAGNLLNTPLPENITVQPITVQWATPLRAGWINGPTKFIQIITDGNLIFQPGWKITGYGIDNNTTIVDWDVENRTLEISKNTLSFPSLETDINVFGAVFGAVNISLISGKLPRGLRLENNQIVGTPTEVSTIIESRFVLRLSNSTEKFDRTFSLTVEGPDSPNWVTPEGLLPVGNNLSYFILDNSLVDFQLKTIDPDIPAGDTVSYYIPPDGGDLPPGLFLTPAGRVYGFTDPIFAIQYGSYSGVFDANLFDTLPYDISERPESGYDTFDFDTKTFDFSDDVRLPRRINRFYQFTVVATDGENETRRTFSIYVVTEDFLRADNTAMRAATGLFTADNTYNRKPLWITESYLGRRRANNYVTVFLDVYDPPSLTGTIDYRLLGVNPQNSGVVFGKTVPGSNEVTVDIDLKADGTHVKPVAGQKICLTSNNTFIRSYQINSVTPITSPNNRRYKLNIGGNGATAQAVVIGGLVAAIKVVNPGQGYLVAPIVKIIGGGGDGATAVARIKGGKVTSIVILTNGIGFTSTPQVEIGPIVETLYNRSAVTIGTASLLPPGMQVDAIAGEITGEVPYQPRITTNYEFTIRATSQSQTNDEFAFADKTFNIDIIGEIESGIVWDTDPVLENLSPNFPSSLSVKAQSLLYGGFVNYSLVSNNPDGTISKLPPGLSFLSTGEIIGKVRQYLQDNKPGLTNFPGIVWDNGTTSFDRKFKFTVRASDVFNFAQTERTFELTITDKDPKTYSNIWVKAFQKKSKRNMWYEFITNSAIFDPKKVYRFSDPEYGVQTELKMLMFAGIESVSATKFVQAMSRNHYRKKLKFGEIKSAVAKDPNTQETVYEVVYVEMVDDLEKNNKSISSVIQLPDKINSPMLISSSFTRIDSDIPLAGDRDNQRVFPNSIKNMRKRVKSVGQRERQYLPLWMRSIQPNTFVEPGFVKAVPLCYTKPGESIYIIANIKAKLNAENELERFDFKMLDFEVDRYLIDSVGGYIQDKYLVFPQRDIVNKLLNPAPEPTTPVSVVGGTFDNNDVDFSSAQITFDKG